MSIILKKALLGVTIASSIAVGPSNMLSSANAATIVSKTTVSQNASETDASEIVTNKKSEYKLKITAQLEKEGWYSDKANVKVKVEKIYGNSKFKIEKVEAKIGSTGAYVDITDDMCFEINENCTAYIKVTDVYGAEFEKARSFKCFDTVAPTLNAAVNEGLLNIMTYDTESGVKEVYVNEYSFVPDQNGVITVRLQKFDATYQKFYIYAVDNAGNMSSVNTIANPYYKDPTTEEDDSNSSENANPADSLPSNAEAAVTNPSSATVTSVTDEDGNDISQEVKRKQFYTIVTTDGQQYYLVIDMGAAYTDDDGVNVTPDDGTVYFLTSVSNQNLLNFVDGNEQTLPQNSVATNNSIDDETVTPEKSDTTEETTEAEPEPEKKKDKGSGNLLIYIVLGLVGAVVVGVKVLGGKKGKADQNDDSLYGEVEEEEVEPLENLNEEEE